MTIYLGNNFVKCLSIIHNVFSFALDLYKYIINYILTNHERGVIFI